MQGLLTVREVRYLLAGVAVLGIVCGAIGSWLASSLTRHDGVLRASRLIIEDRQGKPCILLGINANAVPVLNFFDPGSSEARLSLALVSGFGRIQFQDKASVNRLSLSVSRTGGMLSIVGSNRKNRLCLAETDPGASLVMYNDDDDERVLLGAVGKDAALLLEGAKGRRLITTQD